MDRNVIQSGASDCVDFDQFVTRAPPNSPSHLPLKEPLPVRGQDDECERSESRYRIARPTDLFNAFHPAALSQNNTVPRLIQECMESEFTKINGLNDKVRSAISARASASDDATPARRRSDKKYQRGMMERALKLSLPILQGAAHALLEFDVDFDPDKAVEVTDDMAQSQSSEMESPSSEISEILQLDGGNSPPSKKRKPPDSSTCKPWKKDMKSGRQDGKPRGDRSQAKSKEGKSIKKEHMDGDDYDSDDDSNKEEHKGTVKKSSGGVTRREVRAYLTPKVDDADFRARVGNVVDNVANKVELSSTPSDDNFNPVALLEEIDNEEEKWTHEDVVKRCYNGRLELNHTMPAKGESMNYAELRKQSTLDPATLKCLISVHKNSVYNAEGIRILQEKVDGLALSQIIATEKIGLLQSLLAADAFEDEAKKLVNRIMICERLRTGLVVPGIPMRTNVEINHVLRTRRHVQKLTTLLLAYVTWDKSHFPYQVRDILLHPSYTATAFWGRGKPTVHDDEHRVPDRLKWFLIHLVLEAGKGKDAYSREGTIRQLKRLFFTEPRKRHDGKERWKKVDTDKLKSQYSQDAAGLLFEDDKFGPGVNTKDPKANGAVIELSDEEDDDEDLNELLRRGQEKVEAAANEAAKDPSQRHSLYRAHPERLARNESDVHGEDVSGDRNEGTPHHEEEVSKDASFNTRNRDSNETDNYTKEPETLPAVVPKHVGDTNEELSAPGMTEHAETPDSVEAEGNCSQRQDSVRLPLYSQRPAEQQVRQGGSGVAHPSMIMSKGPIEVTSCGTVIGSSANPGHEPVKYLTPAASGQNLAQNLLPTAASPSHRQVAAVSTTQVNLQQRSQQLRPSTVGPLFVRSVEGEGVAYGHTTGTPNTIMSAPARPNLVRQSHPAPTNSGTASLVMPDMQTLYVHPDGSVHSSPMQAGQSPVVNHIVSVSGAGHNGSGKQITAPRVATVHAQKNVRYAHDNATQQVFSSGQQYQSVVVQPPKEHHVISAAVGRAPDNGSVVVGTPVYQQGATVSSPDVYNSNAIVVNPVSMEAGQGWLTPSDSQPPQPSTRVNIVHPRSGGLTMGSPAQIYVASEGNVGCQSPNSTVIASSTPNEMGSTQSSSTSGDQTVVLSPEFLHDGSDTFYITTVPQEPTFTSGVTFSTRTLSDSMAANNAAPPAGRIQNNGKVVVKASSTTTNNAVGLSHMRPASMSIPAPPDPESIQASEEDVQSVRKAMSSSKVVPDQKYVTKKLREDANAVQTLLNTRFGNKNIGEENN